MSAFAPGPSDLALPPDIPAVLIPLSDSAAHSSKLTENEPRLAKFSSTAALGRLASSLIKLKDKSSPETASMKLEPTAETSQYTLGSDKTSYIFLQTIDEDECWVNLKHCRIIPDPDEDCVVLQNTSTSMFTARNPEKTQVTFEILPTRHKTLHCGCWQLNLGAGLDFLLLVFRRPSRCLTGALTPSEKWTLRQQQVRKEKNDQTPQETPPPEDKGKALPSEDNEPLRIIATTCLTKVVKVMHHERVTALKICRNPELIEAADIWENEREILSRLKHPSIVRLLEFDGPRLTLSLEYIDGKALSRLVDSNGMSMISEGHQFTVWRNISSALQYLHDQDIVHNDIKPENIIMRNDSDSLRNNPDSIAILCDFGVAASSLVFRGGGTPCYLAPQFMYGERGKPSDIWAFGVTMLFVLNYMPLPNAFWEINEVQRKADALVRMVDWLGRVRKIRAGLPEEMKLLSRMLMEEADSRITAPSLCKAVKLSAKRDMAYK